LWDFVKNSGRGLEKANADWKAKFEASEASREAADAKIAELSRNEDKDEALTCVQE
jgi:hypothetical protein